MIDVTRHAGLVHAVAKRYAFAARGDRGITYDDLVQAGFCGAMRAAETYDPALGAPSTYLWPWIRQSIQREVQNRSETVRVPVHEQAQRRAAGQVVRAQVHSLNRPGCGRDGEEYGEMIDLVISPEVENDRGDLPDVTLEQLIASTPSLTANEAHVLRRRASIDEPVLAEVGAELGLSRERIRQLELSAIAKVRAAQGIVCDDDVQQRIERHEARVRPRIPDKAPALEVEVADDVEREVARLRGQGLGLRAVGKLLGISHRAVQATERKLLARLAEALETAA